MSKMLIIEIITDTMIRNSNENFSANAPGQAVLNKSTVALCSLDIKTVAQFWGQLKTNYILVEKPTLAQLW